MGRNAHETLTLSARDFWEGVKTGQPVTISGELLLPKGEGRVPVVVLSHGGGGVGRAEDTWARELRSEAVAVFVVDSFTGRGIKQARSSRSYGVSLHCPLHPCPTALVPSYLSTSSARTSTG